MRIQPKVIVVGVATVAVIAAGGWWAASALKQPEQADYARLDAQRQAVDNSMNVYVPLFDGYATEYPNVFREQRSEEEQAEIKTEYLKTFDEERKVNIDRLNDMKSSVALKEDSIRPAYDDFDESYRAVVEYYVGYTQDITNLTEAVTGKCDLNSDLNIASATLAEDYTKAADACLAALAEAKRTSNDGPMGKLLTDVEKLVKERRDAFKKAVGKEGFEANITKLSALVTLLSINSDLKEIQDAYESTTKAEYTKLVTQANESNEALEKALEPFVKSEGSQG